MIEPLPFELDEQIKASALVLSRVEQASVIVSMILSALNQPLPGRATRPRLDDVQKYLLGHISYAYDLYTLSLLEAPSDGRFLADGESEDDLMYVRLFSDDEDRLDAEIFLRCQF